MSKANLLGALVLAATFATAHAQTPLPLGDELFKSPSLLNGEPAAPKSPAPAPEPAPAPKKADQTEITADNADFNNRSHIAIFTGGVVVKNPDFNVACDKLTAYLHNDNKPAAEAGPAKSGSSPAVGTPRPAEAAASKPAPKGGGLEKAVCEMNGDAKVVLTQDKIEADGSVSQTVGKALKVVYDAPTGDVTLTGWPEVRQGMNSSVATEQGTIMILNREGKMRTIGRSKSVIRDSSNDKLPGKP